jgi:hypothetical protein
MWFTKTSNETFDIGRDLAPANDRWPDLEGWFRGDHFLELNCLEVVMKIRMLTAMQRIARRPNPRSTDLPWTNPPKIVSIFIRQEHVCAAAPTLEPTLEPSSQGRQPLQIRTLGDLDQQVDILRSRALGHDRTDERDSSHLRKASGRRHEVDGGFKQHFSNIRRFSSIGHRVV